MPEKSRLGCAQPDDGLERVLSVALRELVHEFYFKGSHYSRPASAFTRADHDELLTRLTAPGWLAAYGDRDPVSALLEDLRSHVFGTGRSNDGFDWVDRWERAESTINVRFRVACALVGATAVAQSIESLTGWTGVPPLELSNLNDFFRLAKRQDFKFGQPDLMLVGSGTAVLVEMKVRGGPARAKCDADQFAKYACLASACRQAGLGRAFHILTAPTDGRDVAERPSAWLDGPLVHGCPLPVNMGSLTTQGLSSGRRARIEKYQVDLRAAVEQMPTAYVDFREWLAVLENAEPAQSGHSSELRRQLSSCRRFACVKGASGRLPKGAP